MRFLWSLGFVSKAHVPVLDDIAEGVLRFLLHFVIEIVFFYTGECVLKPRWDYYVHERPLKFVVCTESSWWIGFLLWVFLIGWIVRTLLN
jgi:hypothetical protein